MGPESTRFTYNLTTSQAPAMNRLPEETSPDGSNVSPPPTLPPRNYRQYTSAASSRQVPQPQEPPSRDRTSAGSSTSSYQDVFAGDYDQTPERDVYADQLREQSRRISQSQQQQLLAARYQSKPVDVKADISVAVSRPVETKTVKQEAQGPPPLHQRRSAADEYASREPAAPLEDSTSRYSSAVKQQSAQMFAAAGGSARHASHHSPQPSFSGDGSVRHASHHSPQPSFSGDGSARSGLHHHSPQQSFTSDVSARVSHHRHSPQTSFSHHSPRHSPQASLASSSSRSSNNSRGSRHSPACKIFQNFRSRLRRSHKNL